MKKTHRMCPRSSLSGLQMLLKQRGKELIYYSIYSIYSIYILYDILTYISSSIL